MNSPAISATAQPLPAGDCCNFDLEALRTMLREEAQRAAKISTWRDMAIAKAVAGWYTRQHPELLLTLDQPNLHGIVGGIAAPALTPMSADQWTPEEIALLNDIATGPKGGAQ